MFDSASSIDDRALFYGNKFAVNPDSAETLFSDPGDFKRINFTSSITTLFYYILIKKELKEL